MLPPDSWYYKLLFDVWFLISFNLFSLAAIIHQVLFIVMILSYACMLNELIIYIDHPILKCDGIWVVICWGLLMSVFSYGKVCFSLLVSRYLYNYIWYTLNVFSVLCSVGSPTLWASSSELFERSLCYSLAAISNFLFKPLYHDWNLAEVAVMKERKQWDNASLWSAMILHFKLL